MITFVLPKRAKTPLTDYVTVKGPELERDLSLLFYDDLHGCEELATGTYVLAGLEWLDEPMLEFLDQLMGRLDKMPGIRVLNHPRRTLGRYDLLAELARQGRNDFRVERITGDLSSLRFPVFLRSERDHNGPLSPLLHTPSDIERAIGNGLCRGYKVSDLVLIEFCDTVDAQGRYWKYGAFVVGGRIIPRHVNVGDEWMLKHARDRYDLTLAIDEHEYIRSNPDGAQLAEVAALAGVDYGRIDYTLRNGRLQVWEINLNPTIGRLTTPPNALPPDVRAVRNETNALFYERLRDALVAIDLPSTGPAIPIAQRAPRLGRVHAVGLRHRAVALARAQQFLPLATPLLSVLGRRAIRAAQAPRSG